MRLKNCSLARLRMVSWTSVNVIKLWLYFETDLENAVAELQWWLIETAKANIETAFDLIECIEIFPTTF